jgi:hypothetical protein
MRLLQNTVIIILAFLIFFPAPGIAATLQVSWNANTETDLGGYLLYYGTQSGNYIACYDVGKITSYQITGVQNGTTIYTAVAAYDASQNDSAVSVEQHVTVPVTTQTGTLSITLLSPSIGATVSANPVLSWSGNGFSNYTVYISINGKTYTKIYTGKNTSCSMQSSLWSWFIPSKSTITWYVQGTNTSGQVVKSSIGKFIKK